MAFRPSLLFLSLASALIYVSLSLAILHYFHEDGLPALFEHGFNWPTQLAAGAAFGVLAAGFISLVIWRTPVARILKDYAIVELVMQMRFSPFDRIQISFFAGAGEELLFRGAMQPMLGIWITSLIFVGMHGYFKFKSLWHIGFGAVMFALSVGLGLMYEWVGLIAAMTAHAIYDVIMLQLTHAFPVPPVQENPPGFDDDDPSPTDRPVPGPAPGPRQTDDR